MQEENIVTPEESQVTESIYPESNQPHMREPKKPFNLNLLLNIIVLIGLVILYILHFTSQKPEQPSAQVTAALQKTSGKALSVVFVNIDSLNARYEFIKVLRSDLESTGKRLQNEVLSEQSSLEKEAADFQKQISAGTISEDKAKVVYESLMQKQQMLVEKKDRYTQQVANQELDMNIRLLDTVTNFLKRYNQTYHFDYILTHKTAGDILVANDTLDITSDVVSKLNQEYAARKK